MLLSINKFLIPNSANDHHANDKIHSSKNFYNTKSYWLSTKKKIGLVLGFSFVSLIAYKVQSSYLSTQPFFLVDGCKSLFLNNVKLLGLGIALPLSLLIFTQLYKKKQVGCKEFNSDHSDKPDASFNLDSEFQLPSSANSIIEKPTEFTQQNIKFFSRLKKIIYYQHINKFKTFCNTHSLFIENNWSTFFDFVCQMGDFQVIAHSLNKAPQSFLLKDENWNWIKIKNILDKDENKYNPSFDFYVYLVLNRKKYRLKKKDTVNFLKECSHNEDLLLLNSIEGEVDHSKVNESFVSFKKKYIKFLKSYANNKSFIQKTILSLNSSNTYQEFIYLNSLKKEENKFIDSVILDRKCQWNSYIIRRNDWSRNFYKNANQKKYGKAMHHAIQIAAQGIVERKWNFKQIIDFLRFRRQKIAFNLNFTMPEKVGIDRRTEMHTSIDASSPYKSIGNFSKSDYHFQSKINGKEIELEKMKNRYFLLHTDTTKIKPIMSYVETLYLEVLKQSDSEKITIQLGMIFWWICRAKPWILGDPSIAEMLIRSIIKSKNLPNYAWKKNLIPWLKVIMQPDVEIFGKKFHMLFDKSTDNSTTSNSTSSIRDNNKRKELKFNNQSTEIDRIK